MNYDFLVLGSSGMQGRIVTRDLLESGYKVYCADLYREGSEKNLAQYPGTPFSFIDLRAYEEFRMFVRTAPATVVVNCVEGDWNHDVYRVCLEEKQHVIDLGSDIPMTKAQLAMNESFKARGLVASTIVKHLEELSEVGKLSRADFAHLVPLDILDEVHEAFAVTNSDKLSPVFHVLGGRHSFETIRLVRLMRR